MVVSNVLKNLAKDRFSRELKQLESLRNTEI